MQTEVERLEEQRQKKLEKIRELGIDPYGIRVEDVEPSSRIRARFQEETEGQQAKAAGRIVLLRDCGKLIFLTLRDSSGAIQLGLNKRRMEEQWPLAKLLELGDIIAGEGELSRTRTGELTIWVENLTFLSKSIKQPPEKFHGLADVDLRYRQRYVDLWANPEVMERFRLRSQMITTIRNILNEKDFLEVETPMMQSIAGGAAAKPFITHHNTLDMDLFMRIAPELFLKRLLVGGMEKIFEINRSYRNEGIDTKHNPEFTMMELYQAYADYNDMMDITEEIVCALIDKHCGGSYKLKFGDLEVDYTRPWRRAAYADLLKEYSGCDITDIKGLREKARKLHIKEDQMDDLVVINEVFEETVEQYMINPTFVIDYPAKLCPLTRRKADNPDIAERFELFAAKMELANAYTELNDPAVQEENFRIQLQGQQDTMATMDEDFINALKYGMPPAGGLGIGIDRLVMLLTNATSIRDVILFPLLKSAKQD
jgi:lysyl-tRNA synthetase, class II